MVIRKVLLFLQKKNMLKIEYEILLNDDGRPYILLPENYENQTEDKFFSVEMCRYVFQEVLNRRKENLDNSTIFQINNAINLLAQISDEIAELIYVQMCNMSEISIILDSKYHIKVATIKDRDDLYVINNVYDGKIFNRMIGLKVLVEEDGNIYELNGGILNENWKLIKTNEI